jgi:predicted permease
VRARLRSWAGILLRRARWEQEMREELDFHVRARAEDLAAAGVAPDDALRRARLEFGGIERWKEQCREAQGTRLLDETLRHLRDAWRSARRNPGFVAIAVLSLGLGIGANAAVFAILDRLLLSPLPVREPGELHQVVLSTVRRSYYAFPYTKYVTLQEEFPLFTTLFGWGSMGETDIAAGDRQARGRQTLVTGNFFDGLGLRPAAGRLIEPADDRAGGGAVVAVVSHRLWEQLFDANPEALGRTLRVDDLIVQVIGVTPREFAGPEPSDPVDVYLPVHAMQPTRPNLIKSPGLMWLHVMGRLKPDVPIETAQTTLREGWSRIDRLDQARRGDNTRPEHMILEDGSHGYSSVRLEFSRPVGVLMALVAIVFLIACGNIASLLFVRASRRSGELAVRVALGAGRGALIRQWLTECVLLAIAGGIAGLLASRWITDVLLQFVPEVNRDALRFSATPEILLFITGLSVAAACLFGWLPTLRASRVSPHDVLRAHASTSSAHRGHLAELVLAGQLAASLVLVAGALLFTQTLWHLNRQQTGFERQAVLYAWPEFFKAGYRVPQVRETMPRIVERLRASPTFARVAMGPVLAEGSGGWTWAKVPGYVFAPDEDNVVFGYAASPGYFGTLSIPLVAGRDFEEADATAKPERIVVSDRLARHYFASAPNAVGRRIVFGAGREADIVGVVADVIDGHLRTGTKELVYWPMRREGFGDIVVRLAPGVQAAAAEAELRATIAAFAKGVPVESGRLEDALQETLKRDRLVGELSVALGLLGVFLASIGLFGAVAHWAAGRTREIAIRLTLGATPWQIARMVLRRGFAIIALGVVGACPCPWPPAR